MDINIPDFQYGSVQLQQMLNNNHSLTHWIQKWQEVHHPLMEFFRFILIHCLCNFCEWYWLLRASGFKQFYVLELNFFFAHTVFWNKKLFVGQYAILLWKENLNGDGHQFHQYQQNKQSHLIITEITCDFGNLCPGLIQAQKYGGLNRWMVFQPSFLDNWISNSNTYFIFSYSQTCFSDDLY